jgi:C-terminal processing protease CtpA/Prc
MKSFLSTTFLALLFSGVFSGSAHNPANAPPQQAKKVQEQNNGWLGVSISDVGKERAQELKLKSADGAFVASVVDDSPADSVGLKKGDVITSFAGRTIYDAQDLSNSVRRTAPGTKALMEIVRGNEKKTLTVIVGAAPGRARMIVRAPRGRAYGFFSGMGSQGMALLELNEQLAKYFEIPEGEGVLVIEVKKSSAAEEAGVKAGDVLLRVAGKRIDEVSDVSRALSSFDEGEKAEIELIRKGSKKTLTITVEENETEWNIYVPHGQLRHELFVPGDFEYNLRFDVEEPDMQELHLKLEQMNKSLELKGEQLQKSLEKMVRIREIRTI